MYVNADVNSPEFRQVSAPGANELQRLVEQIAAGVGQVLERRGLIERDIENAWLAAGAEPGPLDDLLGHSITYRIAVGPRAGQKLFTLQTVPPRLPGLEGDANGAARAGGFSLHAGVTIAPHHRQKLERLCRYVSRPPVASERLALTASGQVRYTLKTPYRDGTTHIVLEPLDLMARLAALVPPPRMRLTRFHGVFAPHSKLRAAVTPAHRGLGAAQKPPADPAQPPPPPRMKPPIPVVDTRPPVVARPYGSVPRSRGLMVAPPPTVAVRASESTETAFIRRRSITRPPSVRDLPATLCPPPRTAISRPRLRAK